MLKIIGVNVVKEILSKSGYSVIRSESLQILNNSLRVAGLYDLLIGISEEERLLLLDSFPHSKSQFLQDLFVISTLKFKRNGYFVEFGATDGVNLSNTHLLEQNFNWNGILAEPSRQYHEQMRLNRKCNMDGRCVYAVTGEKVEFEEIGNTGLSQMSMYKGRDYLSYSRGKSKKYCVETVSLNDLLIQYKAPSSIDYLSIDIEGGEYDVLKTLDFKSYKFSVVTVEHNYTSKRDAIYDLMTSNGYDRIHENISNTDDWYVFAGDHSSTRCSMV